MIDVCICNGCCNKEECWDYKNIINKYQESPLYIKINNCDDYESTFNKIIENIKPIKLSEEDADSCKEAFDRCIHKLLIGFGAKHS